MAGLGGLKRGAGSAGPFQLDHHYAKMEEPGRHEHDEHDAAIAKVIGLEQRNKGRTSKMSFAGQPPMQAPGEYTSERPQPSSDDGAARVSRP